MIQSNFDCSYDRLSGNLNLKFIDKTRESAKVILGFFIADLRDRVQSQEVRSAKGALSSLTEEANRTSDSLLRSQIYELISRQVEREKVAQAEADFAFKLIEPPVVPDRPYSPRALVDAVVAGLFAFLGCCGWLIVRHSNRASEPIEDHEDEKETEEEGAGWNEKTRQPPSS